MSKKNEIRNAPDSIFLVVGDEVPKGTDFAELSDVTWCNSRVSKNDIEYRKSGSFKKYVIVYMAAVSSYNGVCGCSLDNVYCFKTPKERDEWYDGIIKSCDCEVEYFSDTIEIEL